MSFFFFAAARPVGYYDVHGDEGGPYEGRKPELSATPEWPWGQSGYIPTLPSFSLSARKVISGAWEHLTLARSELQLARGK